MDRWAIGTEGTEVGEELFPDYWLYYTEQELTLSSTSALLVEASTITPALSTIPSISTSSWFSVCSDSPPLCDPSLNKNATHYMLLAMTDDDT